MQFIDAETQLLEFIKQARAKNNEEKDKAPTSKFRNLMDIMLDDKDFSDLDILHEVGEGEKMRECENERGERDSNLQTDQNPLWCQRDHSTPDDMEHSCAFPESSGGGQAT